MKQKTQFTSDLVKDLLKTRLNNQLNRIQNPKCLYAHHHILNILNFAFDFKFQSTLMNGKIYEFQDNPQAIDVDSGANVIFFIFPNHSSMSTIASIILHNDSSFIKKNYYLFMCPDKDFLCLQQLKRLGVQEKINIKKFNFNFIPLTDYLFSLQLNPKITLVQEEQCIVQSLLKIQYIRGAFKNIIGKGKNAKTVLQNLNEKRKYINEISQSQKDEDLLIVLDRQVDLVTPLLTGLSYQCLLDFFFGINMNRINVPGSAIDSNKQMQTFLLHNKKDAIYESIAFMNIQQIPQFLAAKSSQLKDQITKIKSQAKDIQTLNHLNATFMVQYLLVQNHRSLVLYILQKMKSIQFSNSLTLQTQILQGQPFSYEELQYLNVFYPIDHLLKMVCLHSQTSQDGHFYTKQEKNIVQVLLNTDNIKHLGTIGNLVNKGFIRQSKFKNSWNQIRQKFDLFPNNPDCYTNLNIVYSSLSVKIIESILLNKFDPQRSSLISKQNYFKGSLPKIYNKNKVFIYFIGGVSYNQISGLKMLEKKYKKEFVILSTSIINGKTIIGDNSFSLQE